MKLYESGPAPDVGKPREKPLPGFSGTASLPILLRIPHLQEEKSLAVPKKPLPVPRKKTGKLLLLVILVLGGAGYLRWHSWHKGAMARPELPSSMTREEVPAAIPAAPVEELTPDRVLRTTSATDPPTPAKKTRNTAPARLIPVLVPLETGETP